MIEAQKITTGEPCGNRPLRVNPIGIALLLVSVLFGRTAMADECFCLEDEGDNFRHSCRTQQQGIRTVTHCRDDAGEPYSLKPEELRVWTRLADGEGRCNPCEQGKIPVEGGPIRGDDDPQSPEGAANDRTE